MRHLRQGGVVAHATEGVWGLACDPFDCQAVARILAIKGRSPDKGLILIGGSADCFAPELRPADGGGPPGRAIDLAGAGVLGAAL